MNEIERYLAAAAGVETVAAGQDLTVKVDLVMAHDVTAPLALAPYREIGRQGVRSGESAVRHRPCLPGSFGAGAAQPS